MASLGPRDTRDFTVWTGVDATELAKLSLQDGTTGATVMSLLESGLAAVNLEINNSSLYSSLWSVGDSVEVFYRTGTNMAFGEREEYSRPDAQRAEMEGHMLPIKDYDIALGWTWDYIRKAYMPRIEADIASVLNAARDLTRQKVLGRLLAKTDDTGQSKGLGTTGISPGFATTAASTGVDFTPPTFAGNVFANTHEHYAIGATSITDAQFVTNMKNLREHGHRGPYDLLISVTDEGTVRALGAGVFIPNVDPTITQNSASATLTNLGPEYIGYLANSYARVRVVDGMPANYTVMFKSYGANSPLNPLRVRLGKGESSLRFVAFPDPGSGTSPANPLGTLMGWTEFGVGVNDRTAAVPHRSNASWADGTAS